jgi:hypothetical protein
VLKASELGQVIVEREEDEKAPAAPLPTPGEAQRQPQKEGR